MKTSTDQDENGIAERQEQLIQQRMSATLTTLFSARKELPYTKQRKNKAFGAVYSSMYTRAGERLG